jgi:hypothetical protein
LTSDEPHRPFMPVRDGAGFFDLDNPDDGTAIKETLSLKDRLLLVTEKCTYEVKLADQIDPNRTNPNLPHNVRRKVLDYGIGSEPLCRILLQAKALFREGFLPIDVGTAMNLAVSALEQFAAPDRVAKDFESIELAATERFAQTKQQARSVGLPSVAHIDSHCKTFAQRAHHFGKATLLIVRLFYPSASNWGKLHDIVKAKYGEDDQFSQLITALRPTLHLVLDMRDGLEHELDGVTIRDFSMEADGTIAPPTIELKIRKSKLARCSVSSLMEETTKLLLTCLEMTIVHMSAKFAQPVAGLGIEVVELPADDQKARHVRFGYGAHMPDGSFAPFLA